MSEEIPLARIHHVILEFLRDRSDAVLFGAQAVNAYVAGPRMTEDVDVLSTRAAALAEELRAAIAGRFHIAVRLRETRASGFRVYQLRPPRNRHLADVRQIDTLPSAQVIAGIRVLSPTELIADKVIAYVSRRGRPKAGTDWRDLASLLVTFPDLKSFEGAVLDALRTRAVDERVIDAWRQLAIQEIRPDEEEDS